MLSSGCFVKVARIFFLSPNGGGLEIIEDSTPCRCLSRLFILTVEFEVSERQTTRRCSKNPRSPSLLTVLTSPYSCFSTCLLVLLLLFRFVLFENEVLFRRWPFSSRPTPMRLIYWRIEGWTGISLNRDRAVMAPVASSSPDLFAISNDKLRNEVVCAVVDRIIALVIFHRKILDDDGSHDADDKAIATVVSVGNFACRIISGKTKFIRALEIAAGWKQNTQNILVQMLLSAFFVSKLAY